MSSYTTAIDTACLVLACVQTSPFSFVARGKGTFPHATKEIGDVCTQASLAHAPKKCTQSGIFQFDINATF